MRNNFQLSPEEIIGYLHYVKDEVSRVYRRTLWKTYIAIGALILTALFIPTIERIITDIVAVETTMIVVYVFIAVLASFTIHYFAKLSDYKQILYSVDRYLKRSNNPYMQQHPEELNYIFSKFLKSVCRTLKINRERMLSYLMNNELSKAL